tara:strand:+ start:130 stop:348 length:219 start_codon:yes stop_codon:yes gene_type:complete
MDPSAIHLPPEDPLLLGIKRESIFDNRFVNSVSVIPRQSTLEQHSLPKVSTIRRIDLTYHKNNLPSEVKWEW